MPEPASFHPRLLRQLAWTGFVLMVLVTTSSAYLRLRAAGLGCADWPRCYGQRATQTPAVRGEGMVAARGESVAAARGERVAAARGERVAAARGERVAAARGERVAAARVVHRLSASAAGMVALLIVALAARRASRDNQALAVGLALLILAALLAWLGRSTPQARVAAVAMGNLVGGMSMSALFLFLAVGRESRPRAHAGSTMGLILAAVLLTLLQLAYGAMTSASYSGLACTTLPDCAGTWWPADAAWSAFDPWRAVARENLTANMTLHMVHRYGGVLLGVLLLALGAHLVSHGAARWGIALVLLVLAQWFIGATMVMHTLPVMPALLHNLLAGLLLVTLAGALAGQIRTREPA